MTLPCAFAARSWTGAIMDGCFSAGSSYCPAFITAASAMRRAALHASAKIVRKIRTAAACSGLLRVATKICLRHRSGPGRRVCAGGSAGDRAVWMTENSPTCMQLSSNTDEAHPCPCRRGDTGCCRQHCSRGSWYDPTAAQTDENTAI